MVASGSADSAGECSGEDGAEEGAERSGVDGVTGLDDSPLPACSGDDGCGADACATALGMGGAALSSMSALGATLGCLEARKASKEGTTADAPSRCCAKCCRR